MVVSVDLGALRRNVRRLSDTVADSALWAVVKADAYGHGAVEVARVAIAEGAQAVCVATPREGLRIRTALPAARIIVMGRCPDADLRAIRDARIELVAQGPPFAEGIPLHLKLDTGMGRYGMTELPPVPANAVGLMSHFATADTDLDFALSQLERFRSVATAYPSLEAHIANSAAALRIPTSRLSAVRCGVAMYGLSPFGTDPGSDGLEPVLSWRSEIAQVKRLEVGQSTGYGRAFVAERSTWIGVVPVGYADGFRRDLTGTSVLVDGARRSVVGTISMDSFAVELTGPVPEGTPVTIIGDGLLAEEHARVAATINYEITCGIRTHPDRADRELRDG